MVGRGVGKRLRGLEVYIWAALIRFQGFGLQASQGEGSCQGLHG